MAEPPGHTGRLEGLWDHVRELISSLQGISELRQYSVQLKEHTLDMQCHLPLTIGVADKAPVPSLIEQCSIDACIAFT